MDWETESRLPVFTSAPPPLPPNRNPKTALLTGATGFLGAFLFKSLLERTDFNFMVLVRAKNSLEGLQRLIKTLSKFQINLDSAWIDRIEVVRLLPLPLPPPPPSDVSLQISGDLSQSMFGIAPEKYTELVSKVSHVYNSAARVNSVLPYQGAGAFSGFPILLSFSALDEISSLTSF